MTRAAILTSQYLLCSGSDYWGGNHRVATIFRFAADGSCDRNQHPHLNDRRVCRFIIIGAILNIISLAALGFAAGMVVDNAIVVIESLPISRVNQMQAAIDGTQEVAGGILAATLKRCRIRATCVG